jgi:hypothetical protein
MARTFYPEEAALERVGLLMERDTGQVEVPIRRLHRPVPRCGHDRER